MSLEFYLGTSFLAGKMVRYRRWCALGRGLGPYPQENVSVPLSEHIYSSVSTGRQELSQCHYFKLQLGKLWGEKLPAPHIVSDSTDIFPLASHTL